MTTAISFAGFVTWAHRDPQGIPARRVLEERPEAWSRRTFDEEVSALKLVDAAMSLDLWRGPQEWAVFSREVIDPGPVEAVAYYADSAASAVLPSAWEAVRGPVERAAREGGHIAISGEMQNLQRRFRQGLAVVYGMRARRVADTIREYAAQVPIDQWRGESAAFRYRVWYAIKPLFPNAEATRNALHAALVLLEAPSDVDGEGDGVPDFSTRELIERFGPRPASSEDRTLNQHGPIDPRPASTQEAYFVTARQGGSTVFLLGPYESHREAILVVPQAAQRINEENLDPFGKAAVGTARAPRSTRVRWPLSAPSEAPLAQMTQADLTREIRVFLEQHPEAIPAMSGEETLAWYQREASQPRAMPGFSVDLRWLRTPGVTKIIDLGWWPVWYYRIHLERYAETHPEDPAARRIGQILAYSDFEEDRNVSGTAALRDALPEEIPAWDGAPLAALWVVGIDRWNRYTRGRAETSIGLFLRISEHAPVKVTLYRGVAGYQKDQYRIDRALGSDGVEYQSDANNLQVVFQGGRLQDRKANRAARADRRRADQEEYDRLGRIIPPFDPKTWPLLREYLSQAGIDADPQDYQDRLIDQVLRYYLAGEADAGRDLAERVLGSRIAGSLERIATESRPAKASEAPPENAPWALTPERYEQTGMFAHPDLERSSHARDIEQTRADVRITARNYVEALGGREKLQRKVQDAIFRDDEAAAAWAAKNARLHAGLRDAYLAAERAYRRSDRSAGVYFTHRYHVKAALRDGLPVPASVLRRYPDLTDPRKLRDRPFPAPGTVGALPVGMDWVGDWTTWGQLDAHAPIGRAAPAVQNPRVVWRAAHELRGSPRVYLDETSEGDFVVFAVKNGAELGRQRFRDLPSAWDRVAVLLNDLTPDPAA